MENKPAKPKRVGNHYIPPPARKQGTEPQDISRIKERPAKLCGVKQEKLCDDSSLLFKDNSLKLEEKTKPRRKSKRTNKKANAENTSIPRAVEAQPNLPSYGDSDIGIFHPNAPREKCGVSDKDLVKSHLPLYDLENTRSRDSNSVETPGKLSDSDESRLSASLNCPLSLQLMESDPSEKVVKNADSSSDANDRVGGMIATVNDSIPEHDVSEVYCPTGTDLDSRKEDTSHMVEDFSSRKSAALEEPHKITVNNYHSFGQEESSCDTVEPKYVPESRGVSHVPSPASLKNDDSSPSTPCDRVASRAKDTETKVKPSSNGNQELISVDDGDWDSIYDDSGDCLVPQSATASPTQVENGLAKMKISPKQPVPEKTYENCSSIIEIYGFSEDLKTNDLLSVFGNFINKGFNLKWVDNTHALGIFPSTFLADEALSCNLPLVKTRPIDQGTALSQERAKNLVLPSSLRPKTCSALARRLVSGALGLRVKATPEERAAERELLREAREKKKLVSKQRDAAWEGNFSSVDGSEEKDSV